MSDRTRTIVIFVVTAIWAANFVAGLVVRDYNPSETINAIFMAIVGGLFALGSREQQQPPRRDDTAGPDGARHRKEE